MVKRLSKKRAILSSDSLPLQSAALSVSILRVIQHTRRGFLLKTARISQTWLAPLQMLKIQLQAANRMLLTTRRRSRCVLRCGQRLGLSCTLSPRLQTVGSGLPTLCRLQRHSPRNDRDSYSYQSLLLSSVSRFSPVHVHESQWPDCLVWILRRSSHLAWIVVSQSEVSQVAKTARTPKHTTQGCAYQGTAYHHSSALWGSKRGSVASSSILRTPTS